MDRGSIVRELNPIFSDVLDRSDLELGPGSNASNVEGWDSLAHINLVVSIEKHYGIRFALGELQDLKDVGEMADLILKKIARIKG
jgi:acyl carrier protein